MEYTHVQIRGCWPSRRRVRFAAHSASALARTVEGEQRDRLVKAPPPSLDGRSEPYVFVVRVEVLEGRLEEDDEVAGAGARRGSIHVIGT